MSFKFINSVYKDYGLTRRQFVMSALIKHCCLWAAESLNANEDVIAELKHSISTELLAEKRSEEPKTAALKVKETCVDKVEEPDMVKIVNKINDLIDHGDKRILQDKPESADKAKEAVAFYTEVKRSFIIVVPNTLPAVGAKYRLAVEAIDAQNLTVKISDIIT